MIYLSGYEEANKMKPLINIYRIDEGIEVRVSEETDKR